ncbi:hypothetical protein SAMN04487916_11635 [Arthrobacter sp. ov407]|uniref:hypothetical protein n=1 Tax=Arthrobacter sp. ov407 TaxID=1761748 RepID=UPI00088B9A72|nr:hypothetical protein SAMN04487916_11635 [Arthrobacter sp. ov407]
MTKPDPDLPDPEAPDPDPADARSPLPDADAATSGAQHSGATPPQESQPPQSQPHESLTGDAQAADDDAVWLDLVARLEGVWADGDEAAGGPAGGTDSAAGAGSGSAFPPGRTFRDFDPLGLSGAAPIELSAKERLAPAPGQPAAGSNEIPDTTPGPRDYEPDDDGAFVPEEPPSLAGADPMTVLAWIGAVGGPIALVLSAMFWRSAPLLAILGMVAAFAVAVVFLIMKLPGEKDEHDDGARI